MAMPKGQSGNPKGRTPGSKNKITLLLNEWLEKDIMVSGDFKHPMTIMLEVANNEELDWDVRLRAAEKIMPYIRARMSQVELTGKDGGPLEVNLSGAKDVLAQLINENGEK